MPLRADVDLRRIVPILVSPENLDVDIFTCTHNHQDHTDPETIRGLRHKDTTHFVGPMPTCDVYSAEGVEQSRIVRVWPKSEYEYRKISAWSARLPCPPTIRT